MIRLFLPVVLLASVLSSNAQSSEPSNAASQANAMQRLSVADKYLSYRDTQKALSIYRDILRDEQVNFALRRIAELKYNAALDSKLHYTFSANANPIAPNRKYKTDTLYVQIGGTSVPFKIHRNAAAHTVLSFSQKLYMYPDLNKERVSFDYFTFAHSFKRDSVDREENTIGIGVKPHLPSDNLNVFYNIDWTQDHLDNENIKHTVKASWVAKRFDLDVSLASTDINPDLNTPIKATRDLTVTTTLSSEYNGYAFDAQHEHKTFAVPGNDYGVTTFGVSKYLDLLGSSIRLEHQSRKDEQPKFPANLARRDVTQSVSLAKQVRAFNMKPVINIKASRNTSNIGIYSYDEVSTYVSFGF